MAKKMKYKKPERLDAEDIRLINEVKPLRGTQERMVYEVLQELRAKKKDKGYKARGASGKK